MKPPEEVLAVAQDFIVEMRQTIQPEGKRARRARNYDDILSWIEQKIFTWSELGIPANEFIILFMAVLQQCPELKDVPRFQSWVMADLGRRFINVENGISEAGSPMARVIPFIKTAA